MSISCEEEDDRPAYEYAGVYDSKDGLGENSGTGGKEA